MSVLDVTVVSVLLERQQVKVEDDHRFVYTITPQTAGLEWRSLCPGDKLRIWIAMGVPRVERAELRGKTCNESTGKLIPQ